MSRRNWFLFIFVGFLWGIPYLLIKVAVDELSPAVIVFSRVAIGSAILIPMAMRLGSLMPAINAWRYVIPYAIGEMIDVDGVTGGFNFQAAWTTAWFAAESISKKLT